MQHPDLNENLYEENKQDYRQHPREHFLKKGYIEPSSIEEKVDKDVDGKYVLVWQFLYLNSDLPPKYQIRTWYYIFCRLSITDLDSVLKGKNSNQTEDPRENRSLTRYEEPKPFGGMIFDRMVQIKTTRKADGVS